MPEPDPALIGQTVEYTPATESQPSAPSRADVATAVAKAPSEAAQEIVFSPQGRPADADPLRLFFETDAEDIEHQVAGAAETAYVLGGRTDLLELGSAMRGTVRDVGMLVPVPTQGETRYLGPDDTPKRHKLVTLYPPAAGAVLQRARESVDLIGPLAAQWGADLLAEHREMVVDEAFRYLLTGESERTGDERSRAAAIARHLNASPGGVDVSGPDAAPLVTALKAVRAPRDELRGIERAALERQVLRRGAAAAMAVLDPARYAMLPFGAVTTAEEDRAEVDARVRIAAEIERIAADHPIVHRLWTTDAVDMVAEVERRNARMDDDQLARRLSTDFRYRDAVGGALKETFDACTGMRDELLDHAAVWEYPRAVRGALEYLGVPRGSLAAAAAREQLAERAGEHELIGHVNDVLGICQLVALTGVVTAPVAAVLEAVSAVLGAVEAAEKAWVAWHEDRASRTHLNPGLSFGAEPSYAMVIVAVIAAGFGAFGLRGVKL